MDDDFDLRELSDARVGEVPWYFRLGRFLSKHRIRGGERLIATARRHGMLDRLAEYSIGRVPFRVPLWRPCNQWLEDDVNHYEAAFMDALGRHICALRDDVTLVDCGADIGTVSAILHARCANITRIIAFEPNKAAHRVLEQNLRIMPITTEARHAAVGNFTGRAALVHAAQDPSAHAMYIEPAAEGSVDVERIDEFGLPPDKTYVIKIDVEGKEPSVIEGAARTIASAREVIVAFEAHPDVAKREQQEPVSLMQALLDLRDDLGFEVDKAPSHTVRLDTPFFEQLPTTRVYNVIAYSRGAAT